MKASIDRDNCIGCGQCADICASVFRMTEEGYAEVYAEPVPAEDEGNARKAAEDCPTAAITLE
jgi:ferredoxin